MIRYKNKIKYRYHIWDQVCPVRVIFSASGIILIRNDVRDVVTAIRLSRATMRKIKQNLFWAFAYNTIGVPVAAFGLLNPIIAAAAMALSSLSVIANSALLKAQRLTAV